MKPTVLFAALVLVLTLATGCTAADDEVEVARAEAANPPQPAPSGDVDASKVQKGSATGTVTALDPATNTVTVDHGPVPELQWPAMTMGFGATTAQLAQLEVGQRVDFDFEMTGNQATITRVEPVP